MVTFEYKHSSYFYPELSWTVTFLKPSVTILERKSGYKLHGNKPVAWKRKAYIFIWTLAQLKNKEKNKNIHYFFVVVGLYSILLSYT